MSRLELINECRDLLGSLVGRISVGSKSHLFDENTTSELFIKELLNTLEGACFIDFNTEKMNYPGIDLGDEKRRECVQVTSDTSAEKMRDTLKTFFDPKDKLSDKYDTIRFIFLTWAAPPDGRETRHPRESEVKKVIEGMDSIMKQIMGCETEKLERVTDLLRRNLSSSGAQRIALKLSDPYLSGSMEADGTVCLRVPYTLTAFGDGNAREGDIVVATSILVAGQRVERAEISIIPRAAWNPQSKRYCHARAFENTAAVRTSIAEMGELAFCFVLPSPTVNAEIRVNALVAGWGRPMEASVVAAATKLLESKDA